ncbi:hypothetical protein J437_LFUL012533 [Ladona fulva]|uniref:Cilia- and flagella-associated protein 91 n=1 Tax=Ladona fulva TaxID=123851 RepID=A0A8K0KCI8_LADFU|nr:hypothetical protein J437_LFUL012533 [Ladona fulva]
MKKLRKTKYHGARPHDYIYDPNCYFSHVKDHQRAAIESFNRVAEYQICPNFSKMFSDLKNYPPAKIKVKHPDRVPPCVDRAWHDKTAKKSIQQKVDVEGTHHCLFYKRPILPNITPEPCIVEKKDVSKSSSAADENEEPESIESISYTRTCGTQTMYRESEAQTIPYTPSVSLWDHENFVPLEIFHLLHLKWGKGLPVGLKEVEDIEWDKNLRSLKVLLDDPSQLTQTQHIALLEYVHREKWLHREKEIQEIHNLRMQLAEKLMAERGGELSDRLEDMISRKYEKKLQEKNQKLKKIRNDHKRAQ